MFTQCPECGTVFRVTADVLRVAQGDVRCGVCSETFNALEYLSDDARAHPASTPLPEDTITVEELSGHEIIEMASPPESPDDEPAEADAADASAAAELEDVDRLEEFDDLADLEFLESAADAPDASAGIVAVESDPQETEVVELPSSLPSDDIGDAALEFRGTEEDLARLFVEADAPRITAVAPAAMQSAAANEAPAPAEHDAEAVAAAPDELAEVAEGLGESPVEALALAAVPPEAESEAAPAAQLPPGEPVSGEGEDLAPLAQDDDQESSASSLDRTDEFPILVLDETDEDRTPGAEPAIAAAATDSYQPPPPIPIPPELRAAHAGPASREAAGAFDELSLGEPPRERASAAWVAAAIVLAVALAVQLVHYNRDALARHAVAGPLLANVYAALGMELAAPVDLAAFEVRQWGAATDATAPGTLRMRASIANRASFPQPYPLLRLALQDRFGNTVGVRDLKPDEYLPGKRVRERLLGAGQRADAEVSIVDPGDEAVGFEIDVCVPAGAAVRCAGDAIAR